MKIDISAKIKNAQAEVSDKDSEVFKEYFDHVYGLIIGRLEKDVEIMIFNREKHFMINYMVAERPLSVEWEKLQQELRKSLLEDTGLDWMVTSVDRKNIRLRMEFVL